MDFNIDIGIETFLTAGAGIGALLLLLIALAGLQGGGHV
jgi:hypothetical protein